MLIIHPHWPPSNLVGVHRVRLIANQMHHFGWKAIVLTVHESHLEEDLSYDLNRLVNKEIEVIKVDAAPVRHLFGKRLVGDIGLRAFQSLKTEATNIATNRKIDFIWFSLPPWYTPLMGPFFTRKMGIPYGVDYRDPWVYKLTNQQKGLNRATITITLARLLEPIAIKKAALLSGVSQGYLDGVVSRNNNTLCKQVTFQMGFCKEDHLIEIPDFKPPFTQGKQTFVYAGAYSPNWAPLFRIFLEGLAQLKKTECIDNLEFIFIGTGNAELQSITSVASELGIAELVRELPERIPYLHIQQCLRRASGALVIGSTEPHYSASKLFQCLLTSKKLFAFFHQDSEARTILQQCSADEYFAPYHQDIPRPDIIADISHKMANFINPQAEWNADIRPLDNHNSKANTAIFIQAVETVLTNQRG
jgi:hypothetical protein